MLSFATETVIPFALVVYELIANSVLRASLAMSSYTTRANGITVNCLTSGKCRILLAVEFSGN